MLAAINDQKIVYRMTKSSSEENDSFLLVHYDEIRINQVSDSLVMLVFLYKNKPIYTKYVNCNLTKNETLSLSGITGAYLPVNPTIE